MKSPKFLAHWILFLLAIGMAACATPEATPDLATVTRTPRPRPTLTPRATSAPTATTTALAEATQPPSPSPLPTQTSTLIPTPSVTPTLMGWCSEIYQPGYYVMTADFKTKDTPDHRYDCMLIESSDVVINCDHHSIEGIDYGGYAFWIKKYGFPLLQAPNNVEIRNCKAFNGRGGVFAEAGTNLFIHDNDFSNNYDDVDSRSRYGNFLGLTEGGGIRLDNVQGAVVVNNTTNQEAIGIDVRDSDKVTVQNNTAVADSAWGINLLHTTNSLVSGNTLRDNVRYCTWGSGVVARGCDAGGIVLQDGSSHNVVESNSLSGDNGNGIFLKAHFLRCNDDNTVQNNRITNAIYSGIELGFCKGNRIIGNQISGSVDGILYGFDDQTEIRGNVISNMQNHGIDSWNSAESVIDGNQILNSREAIHLYWDTWDPAQFSFLAPSPDNYASRDNTITHNTLKGNAAAGIHLKDSIQDHVTDNTLSGNGKNIWVEGKDDGNVIPDLNQ